MTLGMAIAALIWGAGLLVWHVRLRAALRPTHIRALDDADTVDVSIVIPARNEAHNLAPLLASLMRLRPAPREIIVVDDGSTDGTGAAARAGGASVIVAPERPADWNGKPWACHVGAQAAAGAHLLFTDADTVHAPDSLGRALAHLQGEQADMISVVPTHIVRAGWEALQGVFHLLLLVATRAGAPVRRGERRFSIGQYLLVSRAAYERIGGHATVRQRIAEDLALAAAIVDTGGHTAVVTARNMLRVRMYPEGFGGFLAGWRRSFVDGMSSAGIGAVAEITAVIGWLLGAPIMLATAAITGDSMGLAVGGGLYAVAVIDIAVRQRHLGALPRWSALAYPAFVLVFVAVSARATLDRALGSKVIWKGRELLRSPK